MTNVDTSLIPRRHDNDFHERGMLAVAAIRMWRRRIISELAATDDEVELDLLSIEMKECWKILSKLGAAVEHVRKLREDES